jgi:predicted alpha/beta hydrolase family esterase
MLPDFDHPKLGAWLRVLDMELKQLSGRSIVVAAHSLAVTLWLHHAAADTTTSPAERVILVAPPSPNLGMKELADFFPVPLDAEAVRRAAAETILICADDDPYCPEGAKELFGEPLGIESIVIEQGGHLNVEAGFGEWPAMEEWVVGRG